MLDKQTKKRIDDCRDILVGKLPDPKAQIEQITIGLIYKFMDDMDKEAVELGGDIKFFKDYKIPDPEFPKDRKKDKLVEFSKYRWDKLFDSKVTATEMLQLYSEAIAGMDKNPNVPKLFRDIFKNAFLPYRDPETLKLFLKTISEFEYTHSEKLGDAFEYLLSVMGSQGDAGQFRTPRHIIDFVTACVNPQKNETVLDPACGTAGFLLSAYKHILKQNSDKSPGDKLKPDDRKKLATSFVGYDISPDMVRLSLVNMYLHGFTTPEIHEYDTLSSEERWQETFDVILANPPFMTPKGGIRPHKKFGVQANKAEVLFTDYIAEHLTNKGRAGIVVPNGIVATSQTAYKQLRKMLVKDSLIAVISLPAGVFQPYSGVKTSVLILDKRLAKKSQHILFLKVENDGFDLGAQRREIDKNDLPLALQTLVAYKECLNNNKTFEDFSALATLVEKKVVLGNNDVVLSGDRYKENDNNKGVVYLTTRLSEIATLEYGFTDTAKDKGDARFIRITDISENGRLKNEDRKYVELNKDSERYLLRKDDLLMARTGATYGKTMIFEEDYPAVFASFLIRININKELLLPKFYWCFSQTEFYWNQARNLVSGGGQPQFNGNALKEIEIPLPPIEIQQQIVSEIEGYQKIIDGAKQIVNNYKPTITINPDWEIVELGEICDDFKNGLNFGTEQLGKGTKFVNIKDVFSGYYVDVASLDKVEVSDKEKAVKKVTDDDLLFVRSSVKYEGVGFPSLVKTNGEDVVFCGFIIKCTPNKKRVIPEFLLYLLRTPHFRDATVLLSNRSSITNISQDSLKVLKVPIPEISEQQEIVKNIEEELHLINANKRLIKIFEQKIKTKIGEVWGVKVEVEVEVN